jgi:hypothetical protein
MVHITNTLESRRHLFVERGKVYNFLQDALVLPHPFLVVKYMLPSCSPSV